LTITVAQSTGTVADSATSIAQATTGNVTAGNRLIVAYQRYAPSADAPVVGDISKSAGTCTLGAFALDKVQTGTTNYFYSAIFSAEITGTGSCTITVAGAPAGSYHGIGLVELDTDLGTITLETTNGASADTGAPSSGDGTSAGSAIFIGSLTLDITAATTITPDAAFTQVYEQEDGTTHIGCGTIYRIVSTGTTDAASYTAPTTEQYTLTLAVYKDAVSNNIDTVRNPEYVGSGAQTVTLTIGATLAPALHASTAAGDLLVMIIAGRCNGSTITNTFSNTWTLAGERFREVSTGATDLYIGVYYKYAAVGEAAPTVTPDADFLTSSTTGGVSAQIATYRYTSNKLDTTAAVNDAAAAATWTPPSVTTNTANCMVISCVATSDDNALNHNTANSFTLAMSGATYDTTTGSDHAVGMAYLLKSTAGAVTMCIWNESAVGNDAWVGVTVAFARKTSLPVYKRPNLFWKRSN
jgi:hypothetical protein